MGTPHALSFLQMLQSLALLERGSQKADIAWPILEELTQAAVLLQEDAQPDNIRRISLENVKKAIKSGKENKPPNGI